MDLKRRMAGMQNENENEDTRWERQEQMTYEKKKNQATGILSQRRFQRREGLKKKKKKNRKKYTDVGKTN